MDEVQVEAANMISTVLQIEHFGPLVLCIISGRFSILLQGVPKKKCELLLLLQVVIHTFFGDTL